MFNIGKVLESLRLSAGSTQNELAEKLCVPVYDISCYEKSSKYPSASMIIKIAKVFNVSVEYLLRKDLEIPEINITDLSFLELEYFCTMLGFIMIKP